MFNLDEWAYNYPPSYKQTRKDLHIKNVAVSPHGSIWASLSPLAALGEHEFFFKYTISHGLSLCGRTHHSKNCQLCFGYSTQSWKQLQLRKPENAGVQNCRGVGNKVACANRCSWAPSLSPQPYPWLCPLFGGYTGCWTCQKLCGVCLILTPFGFHGAYGSETIPKAT